MDEFNPLQVLHSRQIFASRRNLTKLFPFFQQAALICDVEKRRAVPLEVTVFSIGFSMILFRSLLL